MSKNLLYRIITILFFSPIVIFTVYEGDLFFKLILILIFILGLNEILNLKNFFSKFLLFFFLTFFIFSIYQIRYSNNGMMILYFILILTWLSDIGGYVLGKYIGGKKIKIISPNKTFTGFFGSYLFTQFSLFFIPYFNIFADLSTFFKFSLIVCLTTSVIIGDLIFSYIKRLNKIKDYSNFFPGHGGLFDRIDGLIFAVIFFYIYI